MMLPDTSCSSETISEGSSLQDCFAGSFLDVFETTQGLAAQKNLQFSPQVWHLAEDLHEGGARKPLKGFSLVKENVKALKEIWRQ